MGNIPAPKGFSALLMRPLAPPAIGGLALAPVGILWESPPVLPFPDSSAVAYRLMRRVAIADAARPV